RRTALARGRCQQRCQAPLRGGWHLRSRHSGRGVRLPIPRLMDAVIRGTTMPVLEVHLTPGESVVAESGQLGWFDDGIELETSTAMAGADGVWDAAKRSFGGGSFFMTRYASTTQPGTVAFPARLPGKIFQIPLGPERSYVIQRHGFLAGREGAELSAAFHPGPGGSGMAAGFG